MLQSLVNLGSTKRLVPMGAYMVVMPRAFIARIRGASVVSSKKREPFIFTPPMKQVSFKDRLVFSSLEQMAA